MGQQHHEAELRRALLRLDPTLEIREVAVSGWRGSGRRVPSKAHWDLPLLPSSVVGRAVYGRCDLVHRFDLRLPPARHEVLTIHDLPPLRFDDEGGLPRHAVAAARRAAVVFVPSRFAEAEVRELLGVERVVVAHNGAPVADLTIVPATADVPFVVHAGGATKRKNLPALAAAWAALKRRRPDLPHRLVLAGPPHPRRAELFAELPDVCMPGFLGHRQSLALIAAATVVVVPSTYEGFGLPALEAMSLGRVVVAANRGALPEVCGHAALLCEPDPASLGLALERAIDDEALRGVLAALGPEQAARFTWEAAARTVLEEYKRVLS